MEEHAKAIGLADPFERNPDSANLATGVARAPVSDRGPIAALI